MKQETLRRAQDLNREYSRLRELLEGWEEVTTPKHSVLPLERCPQDVFDEFRDKCMAELQRLIDSNRAQFEAL